VPANKSVILNFSSSIGSGIYKIYLNLSAENNEITDFFYLTLFNEPPYFVSNLTNQSFWDCSFFSYTFPPRIDPEGNDVSLYFTSDVSIYISYDPLKSILYYLPPCNLTKPSYESVSLNISDGFHTIPYSFQIEVKNIPTS
jgi:hypothetical protein